MSQKAAKGRRAIPRMQQAETEQLFTMLHARFMRTLNEIGCQYQPQLRAVVFFMLTAGRGKKYGHAEHLSLTTLNIAPVGGGRERQEYQYITYTHVNGRKILNIMLNISRKISVSLFMGENLRGNLPPRLSNRSNSAKIEKIGRTFS